MKYLTGVSTIALALTIAGHAQAQTPNTTPSNVNVLNLLSPFLSLTNNPTGQATLQNNLNLAIGVNNAATPQQQALAISDKNLLGSATNTVTGAAGTYGAGANLAGGLPPQAPVNGITPQQPVGGLGPLLGQIYVNGSSTGLASPLGATVNLLSTAYNNLTSPDLGVAKNYFANGAATNPSTTPAGYVPVPAVAPAGYTLPTAPYTIPAGSPAGAAGSTGTLPNRYDSVLDLAGGVRNTDPNQDVYGSSRPVQVAPSRINQFDPTALAGLGTNPSFPSGHTTYAYTDSILLAMAAPQLYQSMVLRGSEFANSRIVLGVHYPLDIIGSRALASYDLAQAFTNPLYINNAAGTGTAVNLPALFTAGQANLQTYLSAQCGNTVAACAASAANTTNNPYLPTAANQALYQSRLTYGLPTLTLAQAPREAAPAGGPDASILLAPVYGGSTAAAKTIAPNGGISGSLQTSTINQIVVNTETNALAAFYGTALSYWTRIDLFTAAGYFGNVTGTLALDPADRVTTPVTVASGGTLIANGIVTGLTTVGSGGVLAGTGQVGGLALQSGATLSPGNAPLGTAAVGTLSVAGNATFAAGSTYRVDATPTGADRTVATGTANVQGGTVQVAAAFGNYQPRTGYNILSAAGGLTGQFSGVTSNLLFLNPSLTYDPNNVTLTLVRNDVAFASAGTTRNQSSTGAGVQSLGSGNPVFNAIAVLDGPTAAAAFNGLSGEIHASSVTAQFETALQVQGAVLDRLRGSYGVLTGGLPGYAAGATLPGDYSADLPGRRAVSVIPVGPTLDPRVVAVWGQGFGSFGSTSSNGNAASLSRDTAGFVAGIDATFEGSYRIGVAGGYTDTSLDIRGRNATGDVTSGFGAIYAGANWGGFTARVGGVFAGDSVDTRRSVSFPGFSDSLTAKYGGTTLQGFGEVGYRFAYGAAVIEPFVGGAGIVISRDGFTESGGFSALTSGSRDYSVETLTAGARGEMAFGPDSPFSIKVLAAYRHAFGDVVPAALLAFTGGGSQFPVAGVPIDRSAFVGEAGIAYRATQAITLSVSYAGQIGNRAEDHGVRGGFVYRF